MLSINTVRIYAGTVRIHGRNNYAVGDTDISLTGYPEWVFVELDRAAGSASIKKQSTEPLSDGGFLRVPLLEFPITSIIGGVYANPTIRHRGDINIDTAA
jgi:hypothetical protein